MIEALVALLDEGPPGIVSAPQSVSAPASHLPPTKENAVRLLRELRLPSRALRSEADVEEAVAEYLGRRFQAVCEQYSIGGMLGLKIDVDIGDGQVGVELKLADSILGNTNEFHRLIGQAIYYDRRRYRGNLVICVAGQHDDAEDPLLRDLFTLLESYNITCVYVTGG